MRIYAALFLLFGCCLCRPVFSQNNYPVRFEWGVEFFSDNYQAIRQNPGVSPDEVVHGYYFRYIQCTEIPSARLRAEAEAAGAQFIGYVSFGAYLVAFPEKFDLGKLESLRVRSIVPVRPEWKIARNLREEPYGDWAVNGDLVEVYMQVYPQIQIPEGAALCRQAGITVVEEGNQNGILHVRLPKTSLAAAAALPFVRHLELLPAPPVPDDTGGRALHRANLLDMDHPLGKKFDGTGVSVLVRDDGPLGPHIDFQGRNTDIFSPNDIPNSNHGDGVAGILAGAGNLNPTMRGMATGAKIFTIRYQANFQDITMDLHLDENVTITNSSYAEDCNEGYTTNTQTVEKQLHENPTLMHVFSAGNTGTSNCGYGAGPQWGNITGGHKMAKNALAVANLLADGALVNSSSRGPAHDGRLKPDIAAFGNGQNSTDHNNTYRVFSGTSAAAPGIAGCMAQLTHAYKDMHNGEQPSAALLKAALLNTANDLGNAGPDFRFGWGHVNTNRAYQLLANNAWQQFYAEQGSQGLHAIPVPAGTRQARIMLYWSDPPASTGVARALVNDLDLEVVGPDGSTVYLPWKLDPTPDPVILNTPAGKGRDSLNNMEQVAINDPLPGTYTVRVRGHEVPLGPQPYFIVWEFYDDGLKLTYPAGGEGLVPGEVCRIHWDAFGNTDNFTLQYSPDNGALWAQIGTATGEKRMFDWTVPNTVNGRIRVQVIRGSQSDTTDFPLTIAPVPDNLQVERVCLDSMTVSWSPVNDTLRYDVYLLGEKYMDIMGSTDTTTYTIPIQNPGGEQWFSVRATGAQELAGRRAVAVPWPGGLKECQQPDDVALNFLVMPTPQTIGSVVSCSPVQTQIIVHIANEGLNPIAGATVNYQLNGEPVVSEPMSDLAPGASVDFVFQQPVWFTENGLNTLRVWSVYGDEDVFFNDTIVQAFTVIVKAENNFFTEGFQNALFPPQNWAVGNPDGNVTWDRTATNIVGISGQNTRTTFINCYNYNARGEEDYLYLPPLDLSGLPNPGLVFDLAYANYDDTYRDSLRIEVFANCDLGTQPVTVWGKAGTTLATRAPSTTAYAPNNAADWRKEGFSLQDFENQTVIVRFASVNDFGNNIFLDNIALLEYDPSLPVAGIFPVADTLCRLVDTVLFAALPTGQNTTYSWAFGSGSQPAVATGPGPHAVRYLTSGTKTIRLIAGNPNGVDTAFVAATVLGPPVAKFHRDYGCRYCDLYQCQYHRRYILVEFWRRQHQCRGQSGAYLFASGRLHGSAHGHQYHLRNQCQHGYKEYQPDICRHASAGGNRRGSYPAQPDVRRFSGRNDRSAGGIRKFAPDGCTRAADKNGAGRCTTGGYFGAVRGAVPAQGRVPDTGADRERCAGVARGGIVITVFPKSNTPPQKTTRRLPCDCAGYR
ncbi:MAG: S8 family serine peptidase [Lewinellaceae bacterium]|nr:S8 family serine peptidase [Lewinellaceae bacterium]